MNKNGKCGCETTMLPPFKKKKKKKQPLVKTFENFFSLCFSTRFRDIFTRPIWSITLRLFKKKLNWHKCVAHGPFSHHLKILLCGCGFWVQVRSNTGPPTSAMESQVLFYPPKWDPFWCDIWENYQSIREQERGVLTPFSIGWSPPQSSCPLVTDTTYDPDRLLDVKPPLPSYTLHLSWFCLAASQLTVSVILLLLYCAAYFSWYITELELLVISKPGQIGLCWVHRLSL